jgi:hypothetical protein
MPIVSGNTRVIIVVIVIGILVWSCFWSLALSEELGWRSAFTAKEPNL